MLFLIAGSKATQHAPDTKPEQFRIRESRDAIQLLAIVDLYKSWSANDIRQYTPHQFMPTRLPVIDQHSLYRQRK